MANNMIVKEEKRNTGGDLDLPHSLFFVETCIISRFLRRGTYELIARASWLV